MIKSAKDREADLVDIYVSTASSSEPAGYWYFVQPSSKPVFCPSKSNLLDRVSGQANVRARAIALPDNSALIISLHDLVRDKALQHFQVCSPLCLTPEERQSATEDTLWCASRWNPLPPSLGGWHTFGERDRESYDLTTVSLDELEVKFKEHSLSGPLSFITGGSHYAQAQIIRALRDPRWYIDPRKPSSLSKLTAYMGLVTEAQKAKNPRAKELHDFAVAAWKGPESPLEFATDPGSFLWREYVRRGEDYKAELRVTRNFIRFLRHLWLYFLCNNQQDFTSSDYLFVEPSEAKAFKEYCLSIPQSAFVCPN